MFGKLEKFYTSPIAKLSAGHIGGKAVLGPIIGKTAGGIVGSGLSLASLN